MVAERNDAAFASLYASVRRATGLDLNDYKQTQLRRRLLSWAEGRGDHDLALLGERLAADPKEMRELFDRVTINVSELYRNPELWELLKTRVLPDLAASGRTLRCWSAGCSFGAEAYTLSSLLAENRYRYAILGTDIDEGALAKARAGRFDEAAMHDVPRKIRDRYFVREDGRWSANDELRRPVRFRAGNLLADEFESGFDLIVCRNVVIYFDEPAKQRLYERLFAALRPGGVLFVGGAESIPNSRGYGFESLIPFFYRKPLEGHPSWRNAS